MSDNTAAEGLTAVCLCGHAWSVHARFGCFGGGKTRATACTCTAQRPELEGVVVSKAALDALREARKGCGETYYGFGTIGRLCGSRTYSLDGCERIRLCSSCSAQRDQAISALFGEGGTP